MKIKPKSSGGMIENGTFHALVGWLMKEVERLEQEVKALKKS